MKSILIKKVKIQFNCFNDDADKEIAIDMLSKFNSELQQSFPEICPQIFLVGVDDDDIEIVEDEVTYCTNCGWEGTIDELKYFTDLSEATDGMDVSIKGCPECETPESEFYF